MEMCKGLQVQAGDEYVIHVVQASTVYARLRFSLLGSSWFPRPLGMLLWSMLHMVLVVYVPLVILAAFTIRAVLAVFVDALMLVCIVYLILCFPLIILSAALGAGIAVVLAWTWLVITCQCCTLPERPPAQSVAQYICSGAGTLNQAPTQPRPQQAAEAAANNDQPIPLLRNEYVFGQVTVGLVKHVKLVSFPFWRLKLRSWCAEIVPTYDVIAT